ELLGHGLAAQVEQVLLLITQLVLERLGLFFADLFGRHDESQISDFTNYATAFLRATKRHGIGILWATRARQRLAVGSSTSLSSNITVPGFTTAHQNSGSPLPLPMRVSSGFPETGLCGKMRMNTRPSRCR